MVFDYFSCKRAINTLRQFQDLVRHNQKWVARVDFDPSFLEKTTPPTTPQEERPEHFKKHINKLIPIVRNYLELAGINTKIRFITEGYEIEANLIDGQEYDLVENYFELRRSSKAKSQAFNFLMNNLDRGVGFYEEKQRIAFQKLFNPLSWIAFILHIPIWVIQEAGFGTDKEVQSKLLQGYAWIVRLLMLAILALVLTWMGVSFPWHEIFSFLKIL